MKIWFNNYSCAECFANINPVVHQYSVDHYGHALCRQCQNWFADLQDFSSVTSESSSLYFALKKRGVPARLEKFDGFKTIDIAVPDAKVNIEIDGGHHNYNAKQALSDLNRTLHSFKKGYFTLRVPNSLVRYDLEEAADLITEFLVESRDRKKKWK